jgi:predicted metal-binding membrane protein
MLAGTVLRPRRLPAAGAGLAVVGLALVCWIVTVDRMHGMDMGPGTSLGSLPFFLGLWVTMMAAMMLPSALPMVLLFARVSRGKRESGGKAPPTAVFVAAYLAVWAVYGLAAYLLYRAVAAAGFGFLAWDRQGPYVAGIAVAAAGLYELTPLKRVCLRHCRGPLHFLLGGWKPGVRGAVLMGAEHGAFCVGCCWGLMAILFTLGVMSLAWMGVVTALIFAQKVLPRADRFQPLLAAVLVAFGVWIALDPASVPLLEAPMPAPMSSGA